jgi:uncharacterized membrane protein YeiH
VFAISGVMAAKEHNFDIVGASVLAFVTALGGGTLRDVLIGQTPVAWMRDINYLIMVFLSLPICYIALDTISRLRRSLFLFDTIGIALFTILGLQKTLDIGLMPIIAMLMGVVSAVFGGVIRDVLVNDVPLIFRKEVYATACFAGALVYYFSQLFSPYHFVNVAVSLTVVMVIRYLAVKRQWEIPFQPLELPKKYKRR